MNENQRSINDLRCFVRNNLIVSNNLSIRKNSTISKSYPDFPQSPRLPLYKEKQDIFPKLRKNEGNAKFI